MDRLDSALSDMNDQPLLPPIKHTLKFAHTSINKYYLKTDMSNVYRIAIGKCIIFALLLCIEICFVVLHPNLKLKYFHKHGWEKAWIDMAESITVHIYII